jgi:hypothetical protein
VVIFEHDVVFLKNGVVFLKNGVVFFRLEYGDFESELTLIHPVSCVAVPPFSACSGR